MPGKETVGTYVVHEESMRWLSYRRKGVVEGAWALRIHVSEQFNEGKTLFIARIDFSHEIACVIIAFFYASKTLA